MYHKKCSERLASGVCFSEESSQAGGQVNPADISETTLGYVYQPNGRTSKKKKKKKSALAAKMFPQCRNVARRPFSKRLFCSDVFLTTAAAMFQMDNPA